MFSFAKNKIKNGFIKQNKNFGTPIKRLKMPGEDLSSLKFDLFVNLSTGRN